MENNNKKHILVVDDDDRIRDLIKEYLQEKNFIISTAIDAEMAKEILLDNGINSYVKSDFFGSAYHLNSFNMSSGSTKLFAPIKHRK